ncbi:tetratricopeptide repeat protein [Shewanella donghaensis]|uniref:hypothetical protein n=1 Tax=Shewanella donghaensis TaxID=238836 RepID=UPI001183E2BB|nr:hypothetical protein [Shewanella donghaensis]
MTLRPLAFITGLAVSLFIPALSMSLPASAMGVSAQTTKTENKAVVTPQAMAYIAQNINEPAEKRAEALRFISQYPNENSLVSVARALKDKNPIVREAAIAGAMPYPLEHRYRMVSPLLQDDIEAVRFAATEHLVKDFEQLQMGQQAELRSHADKLITHLNSQQLEVQSSSAQPTDIQHVYSQKLLLADLYRWTLRPNMAQNIYQALLSSKDKTSELYLSLSNNYYAQGKDLQALDTLDKGLEFDSSDANLHYSKALTLVRLKQKEVAAISMNKATELAPENAYYWYLNGVLQEPLDIDLSIKSFEQAYLISGSPENLYAMCDIYIRNNHKNTEECISALAEIAPAQVINDLRSKQSH